jgi:diguanylate cyclase (GGDEF)-like protein
MELQANKNKKAIHQFPKLKSLLKKYRHFKTVQTSLLQLSELAGKVTDMASFYPALEAVIKSVLVTDSFYIVLKDKEQYLSLAYHHNPQERAVLKRVNHQRWLKTLTGSVFKNNKTLHCNAAQRDAMIAAGTINYYGSEFTDWLGVPLSRGNQVIGVLALQSFTDSVLFDEQDAELISLIASHIVTAIDRVQSRELLEISIQQRTKKLTQANQQLQREITERQKIEKMHTALLTISEITANIQQADNFYQTIHNEISKLIPAKNLSIALLNNETKLIEFPYYIDEKDKNPGAITYGDGLTEYVIETAKPVLITDNTLYTLEAKNTIVEKTLTRTFKKQLRCKSLLAAPLKISGNVIGVMALQHYQQSNIYQQSDLSLLHFFSQHVSTAIERFQASVLRQNQQAELEKLVCERTQALQNSNAKLRKQIEERRKIEQQLYHEAHHDVLTKLPNRALLTDRLEQALKHLKRYPHHRFSVLFIDLDRFKIINDTLGHQAGDKFLIEVASRIDNCIRDNDILARLGGDEFVVLLDSSEKQEDIEEIASRIINSVEQPFEFEGNSLHSGASIGITLCDVNYQSASDILRDADAAMYQAKSLGRGRYMFFDISMREQLMASLTLEQELRIAIKKQQFELHYQQITDLNSERVIGYEALLRWQHPSRGLLTPSDFLYIAEESGMILDIENWVVEQASKQIQYWQTAHQHKDLNAFISINLSGHQLTNQNQLKSLITLLENQPIELQKLILEFDEAAFSQNAELALKGLNRLKALGVKLALDDYGSGLSSFNFIHSYPFEFIKLDRSFIRAINSSDKNLSLITALHDLGDKFGYRLVAEGIESKEMLLKVQKAGCEFGQGYFLNRPELFIDDVGNNKSIQSCA